MVTSKFPTLERLALSQLRERFPHMRRRGFSKTVRAALALDAGAVLAERSICFWCFVCYDERE
jgi:hypothetical protein